MSADYLRERFSFRYRGDEVRFSSCARCAAVVFEGDEAVHTYWHQLLDRMFEAAGVRAERENADDPNSGDA